MNSNPMQSAARQRGSKAKKIVVEAVLVAGIGLGLAFAANHLSPRRVILSWNYFGGTSGTVPPLLTAAHRSGTAGTNRLSVLEHATAQLLLAGLQPLQGNLALQLFRDPRFLQQQIVFIDALTDQEYENGHIPGAFRFDPYNPAKFAEYMYEVLPLCEAAEQVVVYCSGGDCDASEQAARHLISAGIPIQKVFVYVGGIAEWTRNGLPIELGTRNSGNLRNTNP